MVYYLLGKLLVLVKKKPILDNIILNNITIQIHIKQFIFNNYPRHFGGWEGAIIHCIFSRGKNLHLYLINRFSSNYYL